MNSAKEEGTAVLGHSLDRTLSNVAWEITGIEVLKKKRAVSGCGDAQF